MTKAAAIAVSRCCWTLAPAPPTSSKMAAGPHVSITDKKTAGTTWVSLERDWRHRDRQINTHALKANISNSWTVCVPIPLKCNVALDALKKKHLPYYGAMNNLQMNL